MLIPYGIGSYRRVDLPQIKLVNLYAEKTPTSEAQTALIPRPALVPYVELGQGPVRGAFQKSGALGGAMFAVSGQALFSGSTSLGSVTGSGLVSMDATLVALLIGTGDGFFSSDGTTVAAVDFPDDAGVVSVAVLGDYIFALRKDTRHIYFTLDPATWDALDYVSAEDSTSNGIGLQVVGDQLWVFSQSKTEIFVLTGDADAPIQAVQGRVFDKGALTTASIVAMDNTAVWVGDNGVVYRGENQPVRISDHGIEERIATGSDVSAWTYSWLGHDFYVLHTEDGSFAYDAATKEWHELESYGLPKWRAACGVRVAQAVYAGDSVTGQIWQLSDAALTDDGDPIERWFTVQINDEGFADNLQIDCSTGVTPGPNDPAGVIEMRTSRDGGNTFNAWRQKGLGLSGQSRTRVAFTRLGYVDAGNMLAQFRITDPRLSRVSYVRMNEPLVGRSR